MFKPLPLTVMATSTEMESVDEEQLQGGQPKKHEHKQAAHLDKVTDYVEEQEISGHDIGRVSS